MINTFEGSLRICKTFEVVLNHEAELGKRAINMKIHFYRFGVDTEPVEQERRYKSSVLWRRVVPSFVCWLISL